MPVRLLRACHTASRRIRNTRIKVEMMVAVKAWEEGLKPHKIRATDRACTPLPLSTDPT